MFTAAELLEALHRRMRRSIRPQRPAGKYPPGWQSWFDAIGLSRGRAMPASGAFAAVFLARPVSPRPRPPEATRWRTLSYLLRGSWDAPPREERGLRLASGALTAAFHILWLLALALLMYARFEGPLPEDARRGEHVVQVEFIGDGTPDSEAGGAGQEAPAEAVPAPAPAPQPLAARVPAPPQPQEVPAPEQPVEQMPAPSVQQPLQVTQTPVPDADAFVLPPPPEVPVPRAPTMRAPVLRAPEAEIRVVELPSPTPAVTIQPRVPTPVPELRPREVEAVARAIPQPLPELELPTLERPQAGVPAPELRPQTRQVAGREIPLRSEPEAAGSGDASPVAEASGGAAAAPARAADSATGGVAAAEGSGPRTTPDGAGSGEQVAARPGGLPSPSRGDDWGDSTRNRPGGQAGTPGLFNPDGSPRLAGSGVGGGLPPGTVTEDYQKIDRMGTWLKRPPIGYEPTSLDRYWVPHESLLAEWVRRGIKAVEIPIPGTSKRIACAISLLQLGGACGLRDPDMLDIEAGARPPPDIPFKRDLQEDQDSLGRDPPAGN